MTDERNQDREREADSAAPSAHADDASAPATPTGAPDTPDPSARAHEGQGSHSHAQQEPHAGDPFERDAHDEDEDDVGDGGAEPDYYGVLGVRPNASAAEIRRAYHRLAKLWHPDRYMTAPPELRARAERRMRTLVAAYDVLGDPAGRQAYDGRFAPGGHGAWVDMSNTPPIWMGGTTRVPYGAPDLYPFTPMAKPGSPNGAGIFLGALAAVLGLSVALRSLSDAGTFIGFGFAALLGALAIWFIVAADAMPVRVVRHWMDSDPGVRAAEHADSDSTWPGDTAEDAADSAAAASDAPDTAQEDGARAGADSAEAAFERMVDEALASIPAAFQREMPNVVVRVKARPTADELARLEVGKHGLLLGLYEGVELTNQGAAGAGPEVITIFREPIERFCHGDPARIRRQVRRTVLHEVAHHFGIDHEHMPDWIR